MLFLLASNVAMWQANIRKQHTLIGMLVACEQAPHWGNFFPKSMLGSLRLLIFFAFFPTAEPVHRLGC